MEHFKEAGRDSSNGLFVVGAVAGRGKLLDDTTAAFANAFDGRELAGAGGLGDIEIEFLQHAGDALECDGFEGILALELGDIGHACEHGRELSVGGH